MPIVKVFDVEGGANGGASSGGGGSTTPPSPPAATKEAVAEDGSPSAKTFGAFTDPDSVIASYSHTLTNVVGSTTVSGTGLGPYTFSGSANGDSFVLELDAKDAGANVVATAVHAVDVAPTSTGPSLQKLVDISGVTSYDFLTQGGSGGSGGQGSHTVGGISWDLDYLGTPGPTVLKILNGVLYFEGTPTTRAMLNAYMGGGGFQTGYWPMYGVVAVETTVSPPLAWGIAQNLTNFNGGNESQFLLGYTGAGVESTTSLYTRENTNGTNYNTVKAWDAVLTDITTTPTRMACRMMGGSWTASYDQGTATLPTTLSNLTHFSARQSNDWNNVATPQNRHYLYLNLFNDCSLRCVVYRGDLA